MKTLKAFDFTMQEVEIVKLARIFDDKNMLYTNKEYAVSNGYYNIPCQMNWAYIMLFRGFKDIWNCLELQGMNINNVLLASENVVSFEPICSGDDIQAKVTIDSVIQSSIMILIRLKVSFYKNGNLALIENMSLLELKNEYKKGVSIFQNGSMSCDMTDFVFIKGVNVKDVLNFASISGDNNPLHTDVNHAKSHGYERQFVHGNYLIGIAIKELGVRMNIKGIEEINFNFYNPVLVKESIKIGFKYNYQRGCRAKIEIQLTDINGIIKSHGIVLLVNNP